MEFTNGFENWYETFYEVVAYIESRVDYYDFFTDGTHEVVYKEHDSMGRGGLYLLAHKWTEEFETLNNGREWDGDFFDEIEEFLHKKNNGEEYISNWEDTDNQNDKVDSAQ